MNNDIKAYTTIDDYYKHVDSLHDITYSSSLDYIDVFRKKYVNLCERYKKLIEVEIECLSFQFYAGEIKQFYKVTHNKLCFEYPHINNIDKQDVDYLLARCSHLSNIYFKARFNHIIWEKSNKSYDYYKSTIDSYFLLANHFKILNDINPLKEYGLALYTTIDILQNIIHPDKDQMNKLKDFLLNIIETMNPKSSFYPKIRFDCINILYNKIKKKLLGKKLLSLLEQLCEQALTDNTHISFKENYLELGEKISQELRPKDHTWSIRLAEFYEDLSNKSDSLVALEYLQMSINLYTKADLKSKIKELQEKYLSIVKSTSTTPCCVAEQDLTVDINLHIQFAEDYSFDEIMKFLISDVIPHSDELNPTYIEKHKDQYPHFFFGKIHINNEYGYKINSATEDKEKIELIIEENYNYYFTVESILLFHFFKKAIELNKINSTQIIKYLQATWYGEQIKDRLNNSNIIEYSHLQQIESQIVSFFSKFENDIKNNKFSTLYIQEFDSLILKIEGIIRYIISLSGTENFPTYNFYQDGYYSNHSINTLLNDKNIINVLKEKDIYLLRYFLTGYKSYRNKVAHNLVHLYEYNIYNMLILFIIILRLSNYNLPHSDKNLV